MIDATRYDPLAALSGAERFLGPRIGRRLDAEGVKAARARVCCMANTEAQAQEALRLGEAGVDVYILAHPEHATLTMDALQRVRMAGIPVCFGRHCGLKLTQDGEALIGVECANYESTHVARTYLCDVVYAPEGE